MPIEAELRLSGVVLERVRAALAEHGGRRLRPPEHEQNQLWDRGGELASGQRVLRVRRTWPSDATDATDTTDTTGGSGAPEQRCLLTYKDRPRSRDGVKSRREIELECDPDGAIEELLEALGYEPSFRYVKLRESWTIDGHVVALDTTPLGSFVEIEGAAPRGLLARLGLEDAEVVASSYPELWLEHRNAQDAPADMVWPQGHPRPSGSGQAERP